MKIIGISQRVEHIVSYKEHRDQLDNRLCEFILKLGHLPVPIPNFKKKNIYDSKSLKKWLVKIKLDAVILSGGNDIGKFKYRDKTEFDLISWSIKNKKPIAGICRGTQIIGIYFGVKLKKIKNHINKKHLIKSSFKKFKKRKVNSFHNYSLSECPKNFNLLYKSYDHNIEAIINKKENIYGCMWHPEREKKFNKLDLSFFKEFLK